MTKKHTPEPWRVNPGTGEIRAADWNVIIADTHQGYADAHLVAAAPDLLHVAEMIVRNTASADAIRLFAIGAIRKAKGEKP